MRLSFLFPALALLAAASSPAQTFVFKGERWASQTRSVMVRPGTEA